MSKELAQTVGGKKIAALFAILALITVFATLGNQWRSAEADVSATTVTLASNPASGNVAAGSTIVYTATVGHAVGAGTGSLSVALPANVTIASSTCATSATGGTVSHSSPSSTCSITAGLVTVAGTVTLTVNVTVDNVANGTAIAGTAATAVATGGGTGVSASTAALNILNATATNGTAAAGMNITVSWALPIGITYCGDASGAGSNPRIFNAVNDQTLTGATLVSNTASTTNNNANGTHTTVVNVTTSPATVGLKVHAAGLGSNLGCVTVNATATEVFAELRHMSDAATVVTGGGLAVSQDLVNNVRGSRHTICTVAANTGLPSATTPTAVTIPLSALNQIQAFAGGGYQSVADPDPTLTDPQIFTGNGANGLNNATCFSWVSTEAGDQEITVVYTGSDGNPYTVSWDTDANGNGGPVLTNRAIIKEWNVLEDSCVAASGGASASATCGSSTSTPVVTLQPVGIFNPATSRYDFTDIVITDYFRGSHVTRTNQKLTQSLAGVNWYVAGLGAGSCGAISGGGLTTVATAATNAQTTLDVGTAAAISVGQVIIVDSEAMLVTAIAGNVLTVTRGVANPVSAAPLTPTTAAAHAVGAYVSPVNTTTTLSTGAVGNTPSISFTPDAGAPCVIGSTATITIRGAEPAPLGSGVGNLVTEIVKIEVITPPLQVKQAFLAWAGQRVILEHDWRLYPGDYDAASNDSVAPNGTCPFPGSMFVVKYVRHGLSDGNFVEGLGAVTTGNDEALVGVSTYQNQNDPYITLIPGQSDPQGSCISRVLYESENPGQVNVEAMVLGTRSDTQGNPRPVTGYTPLADNQTKIAFVIYYMKLESVTVSLVDDVAKPTHNSSIAGYRDYNPGNPWDSSKDVSTVDWNVSKDLLVRARVRGWFTSANATGRAAGTDSNGGVLPAGRWVMPDDWAQLAGGPADADGLNAATDGTGVAEAYEPYKDIMIAPNNKVGRSLGNPEGTTADVAVTTVAVAMGGTSSTTTVTVASAASIPVGACIMIDSEVMSVTAKAGNVLTVTRFASPTYNCMGTTTVLAAHAVGALVILVNLGGVPFEGPYSLLDIPGLAASGLGGAALSNWDSDNIRDTIWGDGDVDAWDAPMPPSLLTVSIRGAGFIKEVVKDEVYYIGTANSASQVYPNPFYITNIPDSPFIPAIVQGGGYHWDSWGNDGPGCVGGRGCNTTPTVDGDGVYRFWWPVIVGSNIWGVGDSSVTTTQAAELAAIRTAYGDQTIARDLVVYTDNHGEAMVTANGDFKLDYSGCATNALGGGHHCAPGDKVGASTVTAVVDYPDFRGKHYPLLSNVATVNWTWGGYKDVTIEDGETEQYKYVVFHAMDRDGFCYNTLSVAELLHPVLTDADNDGFNGNPYETVDFMIDSGEGIILTTSAGTSSSSQYTKQFAEGVPTFSTYVNDPAVTGVKEFPLSSLAATGAVDECQAWIKVSNSLLGILDILVIAHDDEGDVGFDKIIDLQSTMSYSLSFRWTLITWAGADGIATADALKGSGGSTNDITSSVTAVYGWDAAAQAWLGYFPSAVPVPGANDLTKLNEGDAYWIAITGPGSVTWTIATNVD